MSAAKATSRPPFTIKGWHVAAGVVGFFAVVIGVDAVFLTLAYRTHPGQVEARPYETGLIYNTELERLRAQEALGWRAAVETRPEGLSVLLQDRDGAPLSGLTVKATLQRPATEQGRSVVILTETAPGRYLGDHSGLTGAWDTEIEATGAAGESFRAERRLTWP